MLKKLKNSFTLLEMVIVIALAGCLLSVLWGLFHRWTKSHLQVEQIQQKTSRYLFTYHRLHSLFTQYTLSARQEEHAFFVTSKEYKTPALHLRYINNADPNPSFNLLVDSLIYVDHELLCIATWGDDKAPRIEVLLEGVQEISFSFFNMEELEWKDLWPETMTSSPLWTKVQIQTNQGIETFTFQTRQTEDPIVYWEKR